MLNAGKLDTTLTSGIALNSTQKENNGTCIIYNNIADTTNTTQSIAVCFDIPNKD